MAENTLPPAQVDIRREMAFLRGVQAPVIFFEVPTTFGVQNGVANITLEASLHLFLDGKPTAERVAVAHLRFPSAMLPALRDALDKIELLAQPVPEGPKN